MKLDIRRLTPDMLDDYLHFFLDIAFTDHPEWSGCCCVHFHWNEKYEAEFHSGEKSGTDWAVEMVKGGIIQGYLAYMNGQVVGWCNANDKHNYDVLKVRSELWDESDKTNRVKSIVCFLVAPDMRGKGIATKLLERVCEDAEAEGYNYIEGYPPAGECDMYTAHHGTIPFFEKHGFQLYKTLGQDVMMRKPLGENL
ncbi:MAG: hypothetical protein A2Y17_05490 [Clostridiales bacterium GWF2_38_85]|nr:MAG: hypothetical protein A2Y17_05490 [Clostridiales bacterium GWF2_38_85]HBL83319.1 N-acetyltransferase [Clostridiales bacterium]